MDDAERLTRARAIAVTSGRSQEHLRLVIEHMDRQVALLTERAEDAEREVAFLAAHSGIAQIRSMEQERAELLPDVERLRSENGELWQRVGDLIIERDAALKLASSDRDIQEIAALALEWARAIHNLEASRKKGSDNKGGEGVYKSNQALTKAHLALKSRLGFLIT